MILSKSSFSLVALLLTSLSTQAFTPPTLTKAKDAIIKITRQKLEEAQKNPSLFPMTGQLCNILLSAEQDAWDLAAEIVQQVVLELPICKEALKHLGNSLYWNELTSQVTMIIPQVFASLGEKIDEQKMGMALIIITSYLDYLKENY